MRHTINDEQLVGIVTLDMKVLGNATLLVDGQPPPKGPKRGSFTLQTTNGPATVMLKPAFLRTAPSLDVDGRIIEVGAPIPMWLAALALLPIGLVATGGAIGGGLGGAAAAGNLGIARSTLGVAAKVAVMVGISAAAAGLYAVIATLIFS